MAIYNGHADPRDGRYAMAKNGSGNGSSDGENGAGSGGQESPATVFNPYYTGRPRTPANGQKNAPIDRQEIIRKIKSRDSRPTSPELERVSSNEERRRRSPVPLPTSQLQDDGRPRTVERQDNQALGMEIERPRSALHRGDFREARQDQLAFQTFGDGQRDETAPSLSTSPVAPWHTDFPAAALRQVRPKFQRRISPPMPRPARSRATSQASLASAFTYKAPTSPLVQSSRPDTPEPPERPLSPDKSRRHTFSPTSLQSFQSALEYPASARGHGSRHPPSLRSERTFPYQAHQPRRSLNSFQSLPQTPVPATRRPSFAESALHHAPMVGSYEESILRGRMSTTPSKPLNFVAQIGVLGIGNCKSNLRCPPHVTVPFPAVFYSYGSADKPTDQPSPYVGLVDLENNLPNAEPSPEKRRHKLHQALSDEGSRASSRTREEGSASEANARRRRKQKQKRRSGSPKAPPGGSYRIPQQGQLQVIIKNPNKTAVKLFLIPYDLSDMEPGQKTFIRQRSYSAGSIIDMPLTFRRNLGTDRPEAALSASDDPDDRPMLRYLVHLHVCCPSKGRYFLYKSIRVVFANRVPDGKEKLRNEVQIPDPKYSTYKPGRDSNVSASSNATPKETSAIRRRSDLHPSTPPPASEPRWSQTRRFAAQSLPSMEFGPGSGTPLQPIPFHVAPLPPLESRPASRQMSEGMELDSERSQETQSNRSAFSSPTSRNGEPMPLSPLTQQISSVRRLDDPFNFERDRSRERQPGQRSESLLSRRLKGLAVQAQQDCSREIT